MYYKYFRTTDNFEDETFYPKDRNEAMRWLRQSESDLKSAKCLLGCGQPFSAHACFHSHQVVEKCLKAMFYSNCGISGQLLVSHQVETLANRLRAEVEIPDEFMEWVRQVAEYYLNTRYPNCQPSHIIPAEAFDENEAKEAVDAAAKVLKYAKYA